MDWFKSLTTPAAETPAPAPEAKDAEPAVDVGASIGNFFAGIGTSINQGIADINAKIAAAEAEAAKAAEEEAARKAAEPPAPSVGDQVSGFFSNLKTQIDEGIAQAWPVAENQPSQKEAFAHIKHFGEMPEACKKPEVGKYEFQVLRDELFDDEWEVFQELKKEEIAKHFDDRFMMACLFARKLDIKRTVDMLTKNLQWRTENNFLEVPIWDTLPKEMMAHDFALKVPGARGRNGEGIIYVKMGNMRPAEIPGFIEGCVLWTVWNGMKGGLYESMDYFRNGLIIVSDLAGMGWHNVDFELQRRMSSTLLDSFPMRVTKILIINPPWILGAFLQGLSLVIKKKVMDRVGVLEDPAKIDEYISKENLVTGFGGSLEYKMQDWFDFVTDTLKREAALTQ